MLITSELTNESARKALFTCVVYTKLGYLSLREDYPSLETLEAHSFPKARHKETVNFEEKINAQGKISE